MKLTGKQYKAIGAYAKRNNLRLALSVPPHITFLDKNEELHTQYLDRIVNQYEHELKDAAKAKEAVNRFMEKG